MNKTPPGPSLDGAVSGFVRCRAQLLFPERGYPGIEAQHGEGSIAAHPPKRAAGGASSAFELCLQGWASWPEHGSVENSFTLVCGGYAEYDGPVF
jgi:hypothetical protein